MSKQSIRVAEIPGNDNHWLVIEVSYRKGGINYFTYKNDPRGYLVAVRPVEKSNGFESTLLGSGGAVHLEQATRFSAARIKAIAANIMTIDSARTCYENVIKAHPDKGFPGWTDAAKLIKTAA